MTEFDSKQREIGWVCPECHLTRGPDRCDPCIGKLPGVLFACCGHGGQTVYQGYLLFENGVRIGFSGPIMVDRSTDEDLQRSKDLKERIGE